MKGAAVCQYVLLIILLAGCGLQRSAEQNAVASSATDCLVVKRKPSPPNQLIWKLRPTWCWHVATTQTFLRGQWPLSILDFETLFIKQCKVDTLKLLTPFDAGFHWCGPSSPLLGRRRIRSSDRTVRMHAGVVEVAYFRGYHYTPLVCQGDKLA